eukprot:TRINITY_DN62774_c0_g1_i1.p1 TRINITY_DN62774_c0_g1~~TRINITY_DN62774_c0_g1_i1.p1  ORF type:complete len:234 (+),score=12.06 TRINITY_DN62774_c0_g1_i1:49-702(+)
MASASDYNTHFGVKPLDHVPVNSFMRKSYTNRGRGAEVRTLPFSTNSLSRDSWRRPSSTEVGQSKPYEHDCAGGVMKTFIGGRFLSCSSHSKEEHRWHPKCARELQPTADSLGLTDGRQTDFWRSSYGQAFEGSASRRQRKGLAVDVESSQRAPTLTWGGEASLPRCRSDLGSCVSAVTVTSMAAAEPSLSPPSTAGERSFREGRSDRGLNSRGRPR